MQRMMIRMFRRNSPGRVILLLDGLSMLGLPASPCSETVAGRLTRRTFLTPYLPSLVGHGYVDDRFVMKDLVKKIYLSRRSRAHPRGRPATLFNLLQAVRRLKDEDRSRSGGPVTLCREVRSNGMAKPN